MASYISADVKTNGFCGAKRIFEYTNSDSNLSNVCGQAACATLLTYCGFTMAEKATMDDIVNKYPPNIIGGNGTTPALIATTLKILEQKIKHIRITSMP
jgi:hypothetical protein